MHTWSSELDHILVGDMPMVKCWAKKKKFFKSLNQNILMVFPERFYPLLKNIFTGSL